MQMLVCLENDCRTYREVIAAGIQIYSDAKVWVNGQQVAFIHEVRRRDVLRGSRYCSCSNEFPVAEYFIERTFSWLSKNRRTSRDYERLCASAEAFIYVAMSRLMVRRLARS
jgi:hypothetical protein